MNIRLLFSQNDHGTKTRLIAITSLFLVGCSFPTWAQAQNDLTLTVSPPLFQISVAPGDVWKSSVNIVNPNEYPLFVSVQPVNFEAEGEAGRASFKPILSGEKSQRVSLATWIEVPSAPVEVSPGSTEKVPFTILVPEDAAPGGHYAALMISNQTEEVTGESAITISSSVASLLFMRIAGEVQEDGLIRSFSSTQALYQEPTVEFDLRFQNLGNVHLQPQGTIVIYNMFNRERGRISLNRNPEYGNVLPNSVRNFSFTWKGEPSLLDIGRYRAETTLAFGNEARQNVSRETVFWVIPIWSVLQVVGGALVFYLFMAYSIRRYIKRALRLEAARYRSDGPAVFNQNEVPKQIESTKDPEQVKSQTTASSFTALVAPLKEGVVDMRKVRQSSLSTVESSTDSKEESTLSLFGFIKKYSFFFVFIMILSMSTWLIARYFNDAFTGTRNYEIVFPQGDSQ